MAVKLSKLKPVNPGKCRTSPYIPLKYMFKS